MKGQMVFEFIVAAVLLFGIIIYSLGFLNDSVARFRSDSYHNDLEMRAVQISELLVHNKGDYVSPFVVGLSSGWSIINLSSVNDLNINCITGQDYAILLDSLNLLESPYLSAKNNYDFSILIQNSTDVLVDCKDPTISSLPSGRYIAHSRRFSFSEDASILKIDVWIW